MERDSQRGMRPSVTAALLAAACAFSACGRTDATPGTSGGEVDVSVSAAQVRLESDALTRRADSLVRAGRHWRASALLAPRLGTPANASPEQRLAGARAAAGWDGWTEVERILRGATWLDQQFGGEGRELLARAALERGQDATIDARLALVAAGDDGTRVVRRVLLSRAHDRANATDSAAAGYAAAAQRLPAVADWLQLRAAGTLADSAARTRLFAGLRGPVARARIGHTDAQARERHGDFTGAARAHLATGASGASFRAAALAARDPEARRALTDRIVAWLGNSPEAREVRPALEVLDGMRLPLSRAQELVVARAAADRGPARAVASFRRAASAGPLEPRDRFAFGAALLRAGSAPDAERQFASLATDPALAPSAAYQRARSLLAAGNGGGARAALRGVATTHAGNASAASSALLLLADLQVDDGDVGAAASSLGQVAARYPDTPVAPLARFRAGLIAFGRDPRAAALLFDSLAARYPADEEAIAARYWAGRAHERAGSVAEAQRRWREVIAASPLSYYAGASASRLRVAGWSAPAGADDAPRVGAVDSAAARIEILLRLGMVAEARLEMDALAERAERSVAEAGAIAGALARVGEPARALRVAAKALQKGTPTRALLRAAYPVVHADALIEESRRNRLDPALVAGLIRQESSWNPRAVSPVGARGLMQLMPTVGASIARARRFPLWNEALLFDPDVSLELGSSHLARSLSRGTPPARALAAYNAGGSRLIRWLRRPGSADPELFTEWIPFTETRDYVRIVQRNAEVYRALYSLK